VVAGTRGLLESLQAVGEHRVRERWQDDADAVAATGAQAAAQQVRAKLEIRRRVEHRLGDVLADARRGIEHSRDGRGRHARATGDVEDGGAAGSAGSGHRYGAARHARGNGEI